MRFFIKYLLSSWQKLNNPARTSQLPLVLSGVGLALLVLGGCASQAPPAAESPSATSPVASSPPAAVNSTASSAASAPTAKIDINSASIAELDKLELPGTKPSLSERIQGGRPYNTPDDMVSKKVISAEEYKLIQALVMVGQSK